MVADSPGGDARAHAWAMLHHADLAPETLADIAARYPEFAATIARHPRAYPELVQWARARSASDAPPALAEGTTPAVVSTPPDVRRRRRRVVTLATAVALVASLVVGVTLVGTGVVSLVAGSPSAEAATARLAEAAAKGDTMGAFATLAPSEVQSLRPALEKVAGARGQEDADYLSLVARLAEAAELKLEDVVYDTRQIAPGVVAVTAARGRIVVDGDPDRLADAIMALTMQTRRALWESAGFTDIDQRAFDDRQSLGDDLRRELPVTFDLDQRSAEMTNNGGARLSPFTVVAVDEGGWFVSPLLTLGESEARRVEVSGEEDGPRRGDAIVAAAHSATPEEAVDAVTRGLEYAARGDLDPLSSALTLPERRFLSLYGAYVWGPGGRSSFALDVTAHDVRVSRGGDRAKVALDDLHATIQDSSRPSSMLTVRVTGTCVDWQSDSDADTACLSEWKPARVLGLDSAQPIFVEEQGTWLFSPVETVAAAAGDGASALVDLLEEGHMSDLFTDR